MNHATLRKIAAATAIICDELGGSVDMFFLLKALYLADRQMLIDYGTKITGDSYASLPKGPVLTKAYNLMKRDPALGDRAAQNEWDSAFIKINNTISVKQDVNVSTDSLSQVEEDILREKIRLVMALVKNGVSVADWMHENCPEWENVPEKTSRPIPFKKLVMCALKVDAHRAKEIETSVFQGLKNRQDSLLSKDSILRFA